MRRTLLALAAVGMAFGGLTATPASATHSCAPGFEIICFLGCPSPPKICPLS